jgi:hypothetical protein
MELSNDGFVSAYLLECETEDAMSVSLTIGIIENGENVH